MSEERNKGGRPKGSKNKATISLNQALAEIEAAFKVAKKDPDSLELFQAIYKNAKMPFAARERAAAKALPYERPALSSVEYNPGGPSVLDQRIKDARQSIAGKLDRLRRQRASGIPGESK